MEIKVLYDNISGVILKELMLKYGVNEIVIPFNEAPKLAEEIIKAYNGSNNHSDYVPDCEHEGTPTAAGSDKRKCKKCGEYYTGSR